MNRNAESLWLDLFFTHYSDKFIYQKKLSDRKAFLIYCLKPQEGEYYAIQ